MQYTWVDGGWRSLQVNAEIDRITGRTMHALARIDVQMPKFLAQPAARRRERQFHQGGEIPATTS